MFRLSAQAFDTLTKHSLDQADKFMRTDGTVHVVIYTFTATGPSLSILQSREDGELHYDEDSGTLVVPGPLRDQQDLLTKVFRDNKIVAAVMMGEFWSFPDDDQESAFAYYAGTGGPPSQHPNRQEGVFVTMLWPLGGYLRVETRRIVRTPNTAYLRPWGSPVLNSYREVAGEPVDERAPLSFMSSWLEECLPQPDDAGKA